MARGAMPSSTSRLVETVTDALNDAEPLAAVGFRIAVEEQDGVVHLRGVVRTEVHRHLAERIAAAIPQVKAVRNELRSDTAIAADVSRALAADPALARVSFLVESTLGEVRLRTSATDPLIIDRAVAIARQIPGVIEVSARSIGGHGDAPPLRRAS
ncbi:MAG: BON domain-containing protein [Chloroflexota bacterium]|nr:BON domain-containing protein [Dehalococcoidia bacterium]MDW8255249.1 BON domain-containing protein [Chloroflexota bacterium]